MFANMGFATKIFVICVLGYQLLSNCGVCGIEDCNEKLDMVIVVDSSFSVRLANFIRVKEFIKSLIGHLPVQSDRIRVSVVRYATQVHVISYLNNQTSKSEKIAAVESMKYRYGATHTDKALKLTRTVVLTPERGDRPDVPNLVIVTTDGVSQNESLTTEEAMALKADDNLKIFVIGIGSEVVDRELESMASRPEMVYKLTNFTQLTQILENLARFSCSDMKEDAISELKSWSNSNSGFIATTTKASLASKASSTPSRHPSTASSTPSQHPSMTSSTPSQHPSMASSTPSQHPSTASFTSSQHPSTASSTLSQRPSTTSSQHPSTASSALPQRPSTTSSTLPQRPSTTSSTLPQRPSTASSTSSQRPSTASSTLSQRPSTTSSTPSSTTFTGTLTSTTFPPTSHVTYDLRSSVFSTTFNLLTSMTPLPSTEFESSDDTAVLSTTQQQTRYANEDLYNSNLTTHTLPVTLHLRLTSESGSKTESTPEQKTVTDVSTLFDAKTTHETETVSSTHVVSKDPSHSRPTETPNDSTTTSEHSTTPLVSTDSETGDFDGLGVIEHNTVNHHTRTASTTYVTTTAISTLISTDVTQLNKVYVTNFTIPVSATNNTFDTSVSQRSMTTTPSFPTQTTSVDIPTHTSTMGNTTSPFHVYTQLTKASKKPHRKNKTLTFTISTEAVSKTTKSVSSQSSTADSQTSTSQITTGVQQPTRKLISHTSSIITQTSVGKRQTQVPRDFSSTESSSTPYRTSEDSRKTNDMNDDQAIVSSTQRSTVVGEYEMYAEHGNASSINTTTAQDIYDGEDGGDISSRDVYIFVAGGSATAIVLTTMGTFLAMLCRRRKSKRNLDTEP